MGLLVKLADSFNEGQGEMTLVGVPEKLVALFKMLGLDELIKIYKSEQEALNQIQGKNQAKATAPSPAKTQESEKATKRTEVTAPREVQKPTPSTPTAGAVKPAVVAAATAKPPQSSPSPQQPQKQPVAQPRPNTGSPATQAATKTATSTEKPAAGKTFMIQCKSCGTKIALGNSLQVGKYKCPKCLKLFEIFQGGKVKFS